MALMDDILIQLDELVRYIKSSWDPATFFSTRYHTVVDSLKAYDAAHWIRFTAIIGGYLVFRPHIEAFFASFQKKKFDQELAAHREEEKQKENAMEAKLGDGDLVRIGPVGSTAAAVDGKNSTGGGNSGKSGDKKSDKGGGKNNNNSGKGSGRDDDDWDDGWGNNMQLELEEVVGGAQQQEEDGDGGEVRQRAGKGNKGKK